MLMPLTTETYFIKGSVSILEVYDAPSSGIHVLYFLRKQSIYNIETSFLKYFLMAYE